MYESKLRPDHEDAYASLYDAVATFTCLETRVIDVEAATERLTTARNKLIENGSSLEHFRVILGQVIHDVFDMRLDMHLLEPEDFNG